MLEKLCELEEFLMKLMSKFVMGLPIYLVFVGVLRVIDFVFNLNYEMTIIFCSILLVYPIAMLIVAVCLFVVSIPLNVII